MPDLIQEMEEKLAAVKAPKKRRRKTKPEINSVVNILKERLDKQDELIREAREAIAKALNKR